MSNRFLEVEKIALSLSEEERIKLGERMFESVHPPGEEGLTEEEWKAYWKEEIQRRLALIDAGQSESYPWEEVHAELRMMLDSPGKKKHD
jgi:putative addiction module component (TIGR02574 family)